MYHVPCELKWPTQINNFRAITSVYIKYPHQFIRYFNKIFILFNFLLFLSTTLYILSLSLYLSTHFFWLVALSLSLYPSLYVGFTPQTRPNLQTSTDLQQDPYSLLKQDPISTPSRSSTDQARLTSTDQHRSNKTHKHRSFQSSTDLSLCWFVCVGVFVCI